MSVVSLAVLGSGAWLLRGGGQTRLLFLASSVCFAQGLVLWVVRSKQRSARDQTLVEVQTMLQDIVNNQLVVIQMADQINRRKPGAVPEAAVERSVGVIYEAIASLSHESLHAWSLKYRQAKDRYRVPALMEKAAHADLAGPVTEPSASNHHAPSDLGGEPSSSAVSSDVPHSDVRVTDAPQDEPEQATLKSLRVPERK